MLSGFTCLTSVPSGLIQAAVTWLRLNALSSIQAGKDTRPCWEKTHNYTAAHQTGHLKKRQWCLNQRIMFFFQAVDTNLYKCHQFHSVFHLNLSILQVKQLKQQIWQSIDTLYISVCSIKSLSTAVKLPLYIKTGSHKVGNCPGASDPQGPKSQNYFILVGSM